MNKLFLSVFMACMMTALTSAFTAVPKATTVRPVVAAMPQESVKVAPLNVMMVDMAGGALADVSPIGSLIMFVILGGLYEFNVGRAAKN